MPKKVKKGFDCVEMKHRIQRQIMRETKGMTPDELLAYYRRGVETGPLAAFWKKLVERDTNAAPRRGRQTRGRTS